MSIAWGPANTVELGFAQTFLEKGPDALLLLDADGTISFLNGAAAELFGYPREQLLGAHHGMLLTEDCRGGFPRVFSSLGRRTPLHGRPPIECVGLRSDQTEIPLQVTCSLISAGDGTAMAVAVRGAVHRPDADAGRRGTGRRGTGRRGTGRRRAGRRRAVTLLDPTLDPTADGIVVLAPDGRITGVNERSFPRWGMPGGLLAEDQARRAIAELAELKALAFQDPLTGLANRTLFKEQATAALRTSESVDVLLLDLDDFKEVNDVLGHHAGDEMLVEVSKRLRACVGPHGTVARLGGDEFVLLLVGCRDPDTVAQRVVDSLKVPVSIEGTLIRPAISLGVASRDGMAVTSSELLRQADVAMYAAKEAGKNCYRRFRPEMLAALLERTTMTAGLRHAVELGEITVHYQPVVSLRRGAVVQFEALARWERDGVLMPPALFIPTAERSGLISEIGTEVLRRSCSELRPWLAGDPGRSLAVNVSGSQLQHRDFAEGVLSMTAGCGVDPHQLVLEVTESVFFDADSHVILQLGSLRNAGVRVALDDFGTGYSSLGRLHDLPVDAVKIDRSFVSMVRTGTEKLPILTSMVNMAHTLGLKVTGEGIETPAQAEYLRALDCDSLQGFLFSRPSPAAGLERTVLKSVEAIGALEGARMGAAAGSARA
ncbi:EAL domain-containing protein [Micrococcaceae bacterium Sec5.7]